MQGLSLQYFKGACKKDGEELFLKARRDGTRSNAFKLKNGKYRFIIWKNYYFFIMMVVKS